MCVHRSELPASGTWATLGRATMSVIRPDMPTNHEGDFREEIRRWATDLVPRTAMRTIEVRIVSGPWVRRRDKRRGFWSFDGDVLRGTLRAGLTESETALLAELAILTVIASSMYWVDLRRFALEAADIGVRPRHVVLNGATADHPEVVVPHGAHHRFDHALRILRSDVFRTRREALFERVWIFADELTYELPDQIDAPAGAQPSDAAAGQVTSC